MSAFPLNGRSALLVGTAVHAPFRTIMRPDAELPPVVLAAPEGGPPKIDSGRP